MKQNPHSTCFFLYTECNKSMSKYIHEFAIHDQGWMKSGSISAVGPIGI